MITSTSPRYKPLPEIPVQATPAKSDAVPALPTGDQSQAQRSKDWLDLAGKEAVEPYMKMANAKDQLRAMEPIINDPDLPRPCVLDIGGGNGLTAPVLEKVLKAGNKEDVRVLNVETETKYKAQYLLAHQTAGVTVAGVLTKPMQALTMNDVYSVFPKGAHIVLASHSMYFEMEDIWRVSQETVNFGADDLNSWVERHPLTKYLDAMAAGGVFVVTLCSAQELGATRTMASGNHNLTLNADPQAKKDPAKILGCFKNMQLFAKHFEIFKPYYETVRNCTLECDNFAGVVRVPLGRYNVVLNEETGVYEVHNPLGQPAEQFHAPEVFRFYASWPAAEEVKQMTSDERKAALQRQTVFLNLLPIFRAGGYLCLRDETMAIRKSPNAQM